MGGDESGVAATRDWQRGDGPQVGAQAEIDAGARPGTTSEVSAEVKRLRRDNAELKRANAILSELALILATACSPGAGCAARRPDSPSGYDAVRLLASLGPGGHDLGPWRASRAGENRIRRAPEGGLMEHNRWGVSTSRISWCHAKMLRGLQERKCKLARVNSGAGGA
jgi:transposase